MIKTIQYGFQSNMLSGPELIQECQANNVVVEAENELLSNFELNRCRLGGGFKHFLFSPLFGEDSVNFHNSLRLRN